MEYDIARWWALGLLVEDPTLASVQYQQEFWHSGIGSHLSNHVNEFRSITGQLQVQ